MLARIIGAEWACARCADMSRGHSLQAGDSLAMPVEPLSPTRQVCHSSALLSASHPSFVHRCKSKSVYTEHIHDPVLTAVHRSVMQVVQSSPAQSQSAAWL